MIGIDVVDLRDPLLKPRKKEHFRFISHPEDVISALQPFGENISWWILWSAKEAVFKSKRNLTSFDPKAIPIKFAHPTLNQPISFSSGAFKGTVETNEQKVLAISKSAKCQNFLSEAFPLRGTDDSELVRLKAAQKLKQMDSQIFNNVITPLGNPPIIHSNNEVYAATYSHHYHYGAFAICLTAMAQP